MRERLPPSARRMAISLRRGCAAREQHVREVKARHQQHHHRHAEQHRRDLVHPALARWTRAYGKTRDRRRLERLVFLFDRKCFFQIGRQPFELRLGRGRGHAGFEPAHDHQLLSGAIAQDVFLFSWKSFAT